MKLLIVNGWSHFNRGDLAIALGTVDLWRAEPRVTEIGLSLMDGNEVPIAALRDARHDATTWGDGSLPRPSRLTSDLRIVAHWSRGVGAALGGRGDVDLVLAMGGHYLKGGSNALRGQLRMRRLLLPLRRAASRGVPFAFWGHSVGPFASTGGVRELVRLANGSGAFACRETLSGEALAELGVWPGKIELIGDPALHVAGPGTDEVRDGVRRLGLDPKSYVAVTLRQPEGRLARPGAYRGYLDTMTAFLRAKTKETQVALVAQCTGPTVEEDDRRSIAEVRQRLGASDALVVLDGLSLDDLLCVYAGARYTVATRLHSAILGFPAGTPAIGISYSGMKTPGVFAEFGLGDFVGSYASLDLDWLLERSDRLERENASFGALLVAHTERLRGAAVGLRDWMLDQAEARSVA